MGSAIDQPLRILQVVVSYHNFWGSGVGRVREGKRSVIGEQACAFRCHITYHIESLVTGYQQKEGSGNGRPPSTVFSSVDPPISRCILFRGTEASEWPVAAGFLRVD
jgi:hypothetical protein